jgi:hypothetical protein
MLNDSEGDTFTDLLVDSWVKEAIQEYSQHFGKVVDVAVSGIASGTYAYAITDKIGNIIQIEYPEGEDPPQYAQRRPYSSDEFWLNGDSYDFIQTDNEEGGILYLADPTQDTTATIQAHTSYDETQSTIEVPGIHHPILIARVRWSARMFQTEAEMLNPTSNSSLLMAQMEQNASRARSNYFKLLHNALLADLGESVVIKWEMDKFDRVY